MNVAVIMAGGVSKRMRESAGPAHKALVPIVGVPLIERNIYALVAHGFKHIVVAINVRESELAEFVDQRCRAVATTAGATLECLEEREPLGTIGAIGRLDTGFENVLTVNVDNLTTLDLKKVMTHHERAGAALTLAAHLESYQVPFGRLQIHQDEVLSYDEKPFVQALIASGITVTGSKARKRIPKNTPTHLPELFEIIHNSGEKITAFLHDAPWVDVNTSEAKSKAEQLVRAYTDFEIWYPDVVSHATNLLVHSTLGFLVQRQRDHPNVGSQVWGLPEERFEPANDTPLDVPTGVLFHSMRWLLKARDDQPQQLVEFDDVDLSKSQVIRHWVFVVCVGNEIPGNLPEGFFWLPTASTDQSESSSVLRRSGAYFTKCRCTRK